jgi:hypothetical protein
MKLRQNQIWKKGGQYIRIVHRDNLSVVYKVISDVRNEKVPHERATKKDFCRMLKGFVLIDAMPKPLKNVEAVDASELEPVLVNDEMPGTESDSD